MLCLRKISADKERNWPNKEAYCIDCLAEYLEVTTEELAAKIEEFKEEGCTLFK